MTMADMEVPEKVTALAKTKRGKELVIPVSQITKLELQVRNLEQLVTKAQEEKERSSEELMVEIKQNKSKVRVWKYQAGCYFRQLKKAEKKLRHIKKKKAKIVQPEDNVP